jgi:peptide/nickel transport system permease protein
MYKYIVRRLLVSIPVLFGITIIDFLIMKLAPGSPLDLMKNPMIPASTLAIRAKALGLTDPVYIQFINWFKDILHGNLGYSMISYEPVTSLIASRIGPTLLLMTVSLILGLLIAVPIGILSATKQYSMLDYVTVTGSFLGISIPNFFLSLGLIYIFTIKLGVLPSGGMVTLGNSSGALDVLIHMIMPTIVLTTSVAGRNIRYVRSSMLEVLGQDYLRTARAKGLRRFIVINKHAIRNALLPIISVVGMEIPIMFGGAVIIEQIFSWPGIGQLTMSSIMSRDYPTIMGINLMVAVIVILANLITDVVYAIADPTIKYS